MILHVLRHGQVVPSSHPDSPPAAGPGDPSITSLGRQQAEAAGRALTASGFGGCIFSSPYRRALETAAGVARATGSSIAPTGDLREMVMREGQMDGFNGADFNTIQGAFPNAIAHSMAGELPDPWWTEPLETAEDVVTRLEPFIIRLLENDEDAAVVGHGASVNGTLTVLLRRFEPTRVDLNRGNWNAALSSFRISPRYECLRLNDIAHLSDDMVTSNAEHPDSEAIQKARA